MAAAATAAQTAATPAQTGKNSTNIVEGQKRQGWRSNGRRPRSSRKSSSKSSGNETRRGNGCANPTNGGSPEGWRPEGWEPRISRFFFLLLFHSLCSLWASFRGISVVFEVLGPVKMPVWSSSGSLCASPGGLVTVVFPKKLLYPEKVAPLGRRGFPLEIAAARICREAGGRVRTNVFVLDLGVVNQDTRRVEVVDGLPLLQGAQLAADTTLVCPPGSKKKEKCGRLTLHNFCKLGLALVRGSAVS